MNKKDLFIKEKLKQDKEISEQANDIFEKIKEEYGMKNNENKVIKISFNKFLSIAAVIVMVLFVGINVFAYKMNKPNLISAIEALIKKDDEIEETDEVAKKLFEEAVLAIRDGFNIEYDSEEIKEINGIYYGKTRLEYSELKEKYEDIFTGEALENALAINATDVEGIAYIVPKAGPGYCIENISVEKLNQDNGELTYKAKYTKTYVDTNTKEEKECQFKIKKVNSEYRIFETNYYNSIQKENPNENNENNELDNETAKKIFEKGAYQIRELQYSGLIKEKYEVEGKFIEKEINGTTYIKTNEKYETVEQKYGEIFTDKALEDVLSERFANVDGILYISYGGATGWDITNVEVEKISEKDGKLTYKASYNDVGIDGFIDEKKQTCEFKIKKVNGKYKISETNYYNLGEEQERNNDVDENDSYLDIMIDNLKNKNRNYRADYYYRLVSLKNNNNGTYTATISLHTPVIISEEEYANITNKGWGEIAGNSYTFSSKSNEFNNGYGYIYNSNGKYVIEKQELGYAFYRETGGVINVIDTLDSTFEITLDNEFVIQQIPSGGSHTLQEYADNLTDEFIKNNMIKFQYSEQTGKLYMERDSR